MKSTLHTERHGSAGPAVLFTHSFAGDVSHWSATLRHLEHRARAAAFDFRGHGKSPPLQGPYTIAELAREIGEAADALQFDRFVLVGHSLGAAAAAEFAGNHAARVEALILVDPPPAPGAIPAPQVAQLHAAVAKDPVPVVEQFWKQQMLIDSREEVKQKLFAALRVMPRRAAIELTDASLDFDARPALLRYPGPKFAIVTPRNDAPLSLHNAVPGFAREVIAGSGHWIQLDKPGEFNQALDRVLARLQR